MQQTNAKCQMPNPICTIAGSFGTTPDNPFVIMALAGQDAPCQNASPKSQTCKAVEAPSAQTRTLVRLMACNVWWHTVSCCWKPASFFAAECHLNVTGIPHSPIPRSLCLRHLSHTFPTAVLAGPGSLSFSEAPTSVIQTQTSTVLVSNAEKPEPSDYSRVCQFELPTIKNEMSSFERCLFFYKYLQFL